MKASCSSLSHPVCRILTFFGIDGPIQQMHYSVTSYHVCNAHNLFGQSWIKALAATTGCNQSEQANKLSFNDKSCFLLIAFKIYFFFNYYFKGFYFYVAANR